MDVSAMQLSARDPFGFFSHNSAEIFESSESEDGGYASGDGRMHLVFARPAEPINGYQATKQWIGQVQDAADAWRQNRNHKWVEIAYTGGPVFTSEVGDGATSSR